MAFFRFSRDKRGYEHFYLIQPTTRRGKSRTRILYWFRTPPNVKVGREPFDQAVRRALEAQNPDVTFDWPKIVEAPIPSAETERWRDRRRAERAARHAAAEDEAAEIEGVEEESRIDEPAGANEATLQAAAPGADTGPAPAGASPDATRRRRRRRRGHRGSDPQREAQSRDAGGPDRLNGPAEPPEPAGE
jgi:hypothetical protein